MSLVIHVVQNNSQPPSVLRAKGVVHLTKILTALAASLNNRRGRTGDAAITAPPLR